MDDTIMFDNVKIKVLYELFEWDFVNLNCEHVWTVLTALLSHDMQDENLILQYSARIKVTISSCSTLQGSHRPITQASTC